METCGPTWTPGAICAEVSIEDEEPEAHRQSDSTSDETRQCNGQRLNTAQRLEVALANPSHLQADTKLIPQPTLGHRSDTEH